MVWPSELAGAQRARLQKPRQPMCTQPCTQMCTQMSIHQGGGACCQAEGDCRRKEFTRGGGKGLKKEEGEKDGERKGREKREEEITSAGEGASGEPRGGGETKGAARRRSRKAEHQGSMRNGLRGVDSGGNPKRDSGKASLQRP